MPSWIPATGHAPRHAGIHFDAEGAAFVGVPAVHGLTYPLGWRSPPSAQVPLMDAELLFELLREVVEREKCDVR
nr:hypothetical protein OG461_16225 [Streptomyces sp. NBC_00995]